MDIRSRSAHRALPLRNAGAALLLAAAALAAGCSNDAGTLARVGDRAITRDEFEAVARANAAQYPGPPDSAKAMLLEDLVRRELMLAEGRRLGFDRDPAVAQMTRGAEDEVLEQALYERLAPRAVPVSEAEVERFHSWRRVQAHMRVIYAPGRGTAEAAMTALRAGTPFAAVSDRFSVPGMLPPGGDLGWVMAGQLVNPLDRVQREAPVGVAQGPLEAPGEGWFVVLVEERREQEPATLAQERPFLADMLRQRKVRAVAMRAFKSLSTAYAVRVEPRAAQALYQRLNLSPEALAAADSAGRLPGDAAELLATYDGGRYTLADAIADAGDPRRERPPLSSTVALDSWIESMVVHRVALIEARRRHLGEEPEVARRLRARTENALLQLTYQRLVVDAVRAGEADARALYAERAAQFGDAPFEHLPAELQQSLLNEASGRLQEAKLRAVTDELRARMRVVVRPERLRSVTWPAAPPVSGLTGMPGAPPEAPPAR